MAKSEIHLISMMHDAAGGNEWQSLSLFRLLSEHTSVTLWSRCVPHEAFASRLPIRHIRASTLRFPSRGTFIFSGVYFGYGRWLYLASPRRVIVACNTYNVESSALSDRMRELSRLRSRPEIDLVYASEKLKQKIGRPGMVEPSLINLKRFSARTSPSHVSEQFVVGRLSRDVPYKHHPADVGLYRQLLEEDDCAVRVLGGTCLRPAVTSETEPLPERQRSAIELLPAGVEEASGFLRSLDCFYYRTRDDWFESFGRVVAEAMACGLPVVCHDRGGYTELIEHGRNGFLFDTSEEAFELLVRLKRDPALRASIGAAARATIEDVYASDRLEELVEFYTREPK